MIECSTSQNSRAALHSIHLTPTVCIVNQSFWFSQQDDTKLLEGFQVNCQEVGNKLRKSQINAD